MNCLSWNIRGVGKGEKAISIRKLVKENKISIMGLIETKHRKTLQTRMRRFWGNDAFEMCEVFANETHRGGIVAAWDLGNFVVSQKDLSERWIVLEGCVKSLNFECCVGLIYGPNDRSKRYTALCDLKNTIATIDIPVLLMGDFNVILYPNERVGSFRCVASMKEFSDWI